jgi:GT2 family glycosyltransferase
MIPDVTYLILNYNPYGIRQAEAILEQTVAAFYGRRSKNLTAQVYLVDQGSPPAHQKFLAAQQHKYKFSLLLLPKNIGIAAAINLVVSSSKSPVIGLITSDVIVTTGMDEDLYRKVQIPEVYQAVPFTDKSDLVYQTQKRAEAYGSDNISVPEKAQYLRCIGSEFNVMFWRRSIFDKVGFYDERWKAGHENIDFSLRCFLDGGCTAISKNSFVWHFHKVTQKNGSNEKSYEGYIEGDWRLYAKKIWAEKWPNLNSYIDIYKPLGTKTIQDFLLLHTAFKHNIYLSYGQ